MELPLLKNSNITDIFTEWVYSLERKDFSFHKEINKVYIEDGDIWMTYSLGEKDENNCHAEGSIEIVCKSKEFRTKLEGYDAMRVLNYIAQLLPLVKENRVNIEEGLL